MKSILARITLVSLLIVLMPVFSSQAADDAGPTVEQLIGAWVWNADEMRFSPDGRGTYLREGQTCYTFRYSLDGAILREMADYDHTCAASRDLSYEIEIDGSTLTMKHTGSGYVSNWNRTGE